MKCFSCGDFRNNSTVSVICLAEGAVKCLIAHLIQEIPLVYQQSTFLKWWKWGSRTPVHFASSKNK